jgi:methylated-DNA-[protein]-cysteine S-methyltransferase
MQLIYAEIPSPIGTLVPVFAPTGLCTLVFAEQWKAAQARLRKRFGDASFVAGEGPVAIVRRLRAYLDGKLDAIDDIAADPGGTPFQRAVWSALREIPCGRTTSYGELARRIGQPSASRAVGMTNGRNPIAIVIPCHRVIGTSGQLTGYAGGLERKRWLLEHEGAFTAPLLEHRSRAARADSRPGL